MVRLWCVSITSAPNDCFITGGVGVFQSRVKTAPGFQSSTTTSSWKPVLHSRVNSSVTPKLHTPGATWTVLAAPPTEQKSHAWHRQKLQSNALSLSEQKESH